MSWRLESTRQSETAHSRSHEASIANQRRIAASHRPVCLKLCALPVRSVSLSAADVAAENATFRGHDAAARFRVVAMPAKGYGMIAARDLEAGEVLVREEPLLRLTPDGDGRYDGAYGHAGRERCQHQHDGCVVRGGEIETKAKLSPAEAGVWAELGNNPRPEN